MDDGCPAGAQPPVCLRALHRLIRGRARPDGVEDRLVARRRGRYDRLIASPTIETRLATAEDYDAVATLYRQFAPTRYLDRFLYDGWLGLCCLAIDDGEIVGFWHGKHDSQTWLSFTVDPQPSEDWTVNYLTVLVVDTRHRRRGIGRLLLEDFLEHAAAAGNTWAVLNPESDAEGQADAELVAFYQQCGFMLLEHSLDHGFAKSWMMGRALVESPRYALRALPQAQEAGRA